MRAHTAQLIVDALWEAPCHRLPDAALNSLVVDAGYTRDAAERVKTRLRKLGVLIKDARIGFWSLAPYVLEPGAAVPATGGRGGDALEAEAGLAIVEALTAAGAAGLTGDDLLMEAARWGIPPTRTVLVQSRLRTERLIECGRGLGARWRIAGAGPWTEGDRPSAFR